MFDVGFTELLLLFVIGLLILGPERLPRVASQLGRWVGRARRTANQLRHQLEREIALEEMTKSQRKPPPPPSAENSAEESTSEAAADETGSGAADEAAAAASASADAETAARRPPGEAYGGADPRSEGAETSPGETPGSSESEKKRTDESSPA